MNGRENIGDVIAFIAVARERSFTRAAAKLGVSQSALTEPAAAFGGLYPVGRRFALSKLNAPARPNIGTRNQAFRSRQLLSFRFAPLCAVQVVIGCPGKLPFVHRRSPAPQRCVNDRRWWFCDGPLQAT